MKPDKTKAALEDACRRFISMCDAERQNGPMFTICEAQRGIIKELREILA